LRKNSINNDNNDLEIEKTYNLNKNFTNQTKSHDDENDILPLNLNDDIVKNYSNNMNRNKIIENNLNNKNKNNVFFPNMIKLSKKEYQSLSSLKFL
jgi:hypothetical protein